MKCYVQLRHTLLGAAAVLLCMPVQRAWTADTAADDATLEEVVVTAERREESAQKAPMIMNVLTSQNLVDAGATDVVRAAELIPGIHVLPDPLSGAQIAIRGIVNNNVNVGSDPSLAMSVDDVYIARAQAAFASFYDIQRIEVLRGPQGTLYGRNSISGAMNIITNDPQHEWSGNAMAEVGNYGIYTVEGAFNMPLGDKIAVRVAGQADGDSGFIDHYWNNKDNKAGRVKVLWDLTEKASIIFSASQFVEGGHGNVSPTYPYSDPSNPWDPGSTTARRQSHVNDEVYDYSAKFKWDTDIGNLTYIRAYTRFSENYVAPPTGIYLARWGESDQSTDELRLASHTQADAAGKLQWIVGFFSYREEQNQTRHVAGMVQLVPFLPPQALSQLAGYPHVFAGSLAEFGQLTYAVTDHWRVTAGLRGTRDRKDAQGFNDFSLGPIVINTAEAPTDASNNVSYRAETEVDLTANSLLYGSVTSGYHEGGWQDANPPYSTYNPEMITSYEVGIKNEFFDHRLRLNLGAYYYDYTHFLVAASNSTPGDQTCACFVNAPKARADGVEFETQMVLSPQDRLTIDVAYESTDYSDFTLYQPWTNNNIPGGVPIPATATTPAGINYSGTPFPFVSEWSGNASYQHIFRLSNGGDVAARVESQLRSSYPGALGNDPSLRIGGYTRTDVNLAYDAPQHWSFALWARNLERATAASSAGANKPGPVNASNPLTYTIGEPRTVGVRVAMQF